MWDDDSPLHSVLNNDNWNLENIKTLLELDSSSINAVDSSFDTPLTRILRNDKCSTDVVNLLLNYGADVHFIQKYGWNPLTLALRLGRNVDVINVLLEKGANINEVVPYGDSLICLSLEFYSSKDVIRRLLDAGCFPGRCSSHGTTLHCAIINLRNHPMEEEGVLQLLIKRRANVNVVDQLGQSVLCLALGIGLQTSSIKVLLSAGGVLNCTKHTNPLLCATSQTWKVLRADVIKFLLEQGACVNIDVIQCALKRCINDELAIRLLLDHLQGADAKDVVDGSNNTLLHLAASNQHIKHSVVKLLVKRGVGVNRVNKNGDTALHEVAKHENGLSSVVETLLKSGSRVNAENASGETPLHLAMKNLQDADTLKMLLAAGSRIGATGCSILKGAIDCRQKNRLECFKMLMKCYFLEKPDFDFQYLIRGHYAYEELSRFGAACVHELQKLDSKIVGQGCTLREFLSGHSKFQVEAANCETVAESVLFDRLLSIIAENAFPFFLDIISVKVGRSSMKKKLKNLQVYTYLSDESRVGEKVVLNYDTVYKIGNLLTDDDLLRFISAFNKTNDHSCAGKVSKENIHDDKRSYEHCDKRPRLDFRCLLM